MTDLMKNRHLSLRIGFALTFFLIADNAGAQINLGVLNSSSVGTPITFTPSEIDCIHSDPHYTAFWDFGSGATPATGSSHGIFDGVISVQFSSVYVTYSTPGDKTVTLTLVADGGSSTGTYALHIYDCSKPAIPHDAIVVNSDTIRAEDKKTYWVNAGGTLLVFGGQVGYDTIFAEPGSRISGGVSGVGQCILYMKQGSVLTSSWGGNGVIYGDGATIYSSSTDFTLTCPTLDFDYTNAPPNRAHPLSVKSDLNSVSISLSPNPTRGMLRIQGLPSVETTVSVYNILGKLEILQNPRTPEVTLDLSKLLPGTYYVRCSSANSVVTKMVVRE